METTNRFDSLRRSSALKPQPDAVGKPPQARRAPADNVASRPLKRPPPTPAMLEIEDRVVRMREEDHLTFKEIARRLGKYPDRIRQLYARALRHRGRVRYTDPATFGSMFAYYNPDRPFKR